MINAILASTPNGGIGINNGLPWPRHSEDLKRFQQLTQNNIVIMGHSTWNAPDMPTPLPNRINYVVANSPVPLARTITGNIPNQLVDVARRYPNKEIFIIGGKTVFEQCRSVIEQIYLTRMNLDWRSSVKLDLDEFLDSFILRSVKPGDQCTYELWLKKY